MSNFKRSSLFKEHKPSKRVRERIIAQMQFPLKLVVMETEGKERAFAVPFRADKEALSNPTAMNKLKHMAVENCPEEWKADFKWDTAKLAYDVRTPSDDRKFEAADQVSKMVSKALEGPTNASGQEMAASQANKLPEPQDMAQQGDGGLAV